MEISFAKIESLLTNNDIVSLFAPHYIATNLMNYLLNKTYAVTLPKYYIDDRELLRGELYRRGMDETILILSIDQLNNYHHALVRLRVSKGLKTIIVTRDEHIGILYLPQTVGTVFIKNVSIISNDVLAILNDIKLNNILIITPNSENITKELLQKDLERRVLSIIPRAEVNGAVVVCEKPNTDILSINYAAILVDQTTFIRHYEEYKPSYTSLGEWSNDFVISLSTISPLIFLLGPKLLSPYKERMSEQVYDIVLMLLNAKSKDDLFTPLYKNAMTRLNELELIDTQYRITDIGTYVVNYSRDIYAGLFLWNWGVQNISQHLFPGAVIASYLERPSEFYYSDISSINSFLEFWYAITHDLKEKVIEDKKAVIEWVKSHNVDISIKEINEFLFSLRNKIKRLNINKPGKFTVKGAIDRATPILLKIYKHLVATRDNKYYVDQQGLRYSYEWFPGVIEYYQIIILDYTIDNGLNKISVVFPGSVEEINIISKEDNNLPNLSMDILTFKETPSTPIGITPLPFKSEIASLVVRK